MTSVQMEMPDEIASEFYQRAPHPERRAELVERIFAQGLVFSELARR